MAGKVLKIHYSEQFLILWDIILVAIFLVLIENIVLSVRGVLYCTGYLFDYIFIFSLLLLCVAIVLFLLRNIFCRTKCKVILYDKHISIFSAIYLCKKLESNKIRKIVFLGNNSVLKFKTLDMFSSVCRIELYSRHVIIGIDPKQCFHLINWARRNRIEISVNKQLNIFNGSNNTGDGSLSCEQGIG